MVKPRFQLYTYLFRSGNEVLRFQRNTRFWYFIRKILVQIASSASKIGCSVLKTSNVSQLKRMVNCIKRHRKKTPHIHTHTIQSELLLTVTLTITSALSLLSVWNRDEPEGKQNWIILKNALKNILILLL